MSETRVTAALIVAIVGLLIPAVLVGVLKTGDWTPDQVVAVAGLFTAVVGTLVGAFLGVQVAASAKDKAEENAAKSQEKADRALGALGAEAAKQVIEALPR